jgi:hypothetical protein
MGGKKFGKLKNSSIIPSFRGVTLVKINHIKTRTRAVTLDYKAINQVSMQKKSRKL